VLIFKSYVVGMHAEFHKDWFSHPNVIRAREMGAYCWLSVLISSCTDLLHVCNE
jgi:hypothetical protein